MCQCKRLSANACQSQCTVRGDAFQRTVAANEDTVSCAQQIDRCRELIAPQCTARFLQQLDLLLQDVVERFARTRAEVLERGAKARRGRSAHAQRIDQLAFELREAGIAE